MAVEVLEMDMVGNLETGVGASFKKMEKRESQRERARERMDVGEGRVKGKVFIKAVGLNMGSAK